MTKPRFIPFLILALLAFNLRALPQVRNKTSTPSSAITFEDITQKSGIAWVHNNAQSDARHLPETVGAGCAFIDYDNDGWLDLFVVNYDGQKNFLYHNNGDGTFTKVLGSIAVTDGRDSRAAAWGDYDNDGFLDLFVGTGGGANLLYHNNTNDNHWLKLRLIGTRSNRAAIGAKVRVRATINGKSFWQMREISGGDGLRGQNSLHVHVGLGNATPDFTQHPKVIDGFSQVMIDVFGEAGRAARSAIGAASLPSGIAVEVEAVVEVNKT